MKLETARDSMYRTVPEFGAIFMSNSATISECLQMKLFGLPASFCDFVKQVKAGMTLFLFEYETRKLHGVFEAASDGEMNIIHNAYSSSGKQYPAQVRANRIWHCQPLAEHEFRDVIRENYFQKYKFHFGFSKKQVHGLLQMFELRKVTEDKLQISKRTGTELNIRVKVEAELEDFISPSAVEHFGVEELDLNVENEVELGDFIPLPSGEDFDIEGGDLVPNVNESHLLKPQLDGKQHMDMHHVDVKVSVKGLYSDAPKERASVFSRLNFGSKDIAAGENSKSCIDKSANDIMEELQQKQKKWRTKREVTRIGVFSRLSFPLDALAFRKRRRSGVSAERREKRRNKELR